MAIPFISDEDVDTIITTATDDEFAIFFVRLAADSGLADPRRSASPGRDRPETRRPWSASRRTTGLARFRSPPTSTSPYKSYERRESRGTGASQSRCSPTTSPHAGRRNWPIPQHGQPGGLRRPPHSTTCDTPSLTPRPGGRPDPPPSRSGPPPVDRDDHEVRGARPRRRHVRGHRAAQQARGEPEGDAKGDTEIWADRTPCQTA